MMPGAAALRLAGIMAMLAGAFATCPGVSARPVRGACGAALPLPEIIARASVRFAIPEALIRSVIAAESNGTASAVSPKGAMGLMQIMPGTWAEMRLRYALGADPFDPCDNIFAGTAYLRELLDRYGDPGFLAAYNAGPGRYEAWLRDARPLPAETRSYVAKLSSRALDSAPRTPESLPDPDAWLRGALFVRGPTEANSQPPESPESARAEADTPSAETPPDALFVPRTRVPL